MPVMLFENKQKKIEALLSQYHQKVLRCLDLFHDAIEQYCRDQDRNTLRSNFLQVHRAESTADDIRREIEVMMYSKALFPESRGDILGLLETMDKIPNQTESAVRVILNQHIHIPADMTGRIIELGELCRKCVVATIESAEKLFNDFTNAAVAIGKIDELESAVDAIEENLIQQIFASNMDGFQKIMLRDMVKHIADISDCAENVGDRIRIIVAKRMA
ncbi:MAG: DUF47 family protein [Planctomycetota bacterium]